MAAHDASRDRLTPEMLDVYGADCPVPPAVWRRFTTDDADVDVILELRDKASAPVLARNLLNLMRDRQPDMMIVSSFLVVSVTMSELVSGVLSLTSWQGFMQKVGTLSRARRRGRARGPRRRAHVARSRRLGDPGPRSAALAPGAAQARSGATCDGDSPQGAVRRRRAVRIAERGLADPDGRPEPGSASRGARVAGHREGGRGRARVRGRRKAHHVGGRRLGHRPVEHRVPRCGRQPGGRWRTTSVAHHPQLRRAPRRERDAAGGSDDVRRPRDRRDVADVRATGRHRAQPVEREHGSRGAPSRHARGRHPGWR